MVYVTKLSVVPAIEHRIMRRLEKNMAKSSRDVSWYICTFASKGWGKHNTSKDL